VANQEVSLAEWVASENARLDNEKKEREAQSAKDVQDAFAKQTEAEIMAMKAKKLATDDFIGLTNMVVDAYGKQSTAARAALIVQKAFNAALVIANLPAEIAGIWRNANQIPPPFGQIIGTVSTVAAYARAAKAAVDIKSASGFAEGGYTGNGGKYEPAGIVHRGEYVMDKATVSKIGVGNLDAMRASISRGYATGGMVGADIASRPSFATSQLQESIASMNIAVAVTDIRRGEYNYARVQDIANR